MKRTVNLGLAACWLYTPALFAQLQFTDVTVTAGIGLADIPSQSVAWGDYDDDGDPDIYITGQGPNILYRNNGDGTFTDVTVAARAEGDPTTAGAGIGVAFADFDNDGDLDIYVNQINAGFDQILRNDGYDAGAGTHVFTEIGLQAGLNVDRSARGAAVLDYNRDGWLDIYATATGPNILYRNNGDMTFTDVAAAVGVDAPGTDVGVAVADINQDGWPDMYVTNRSNGPSNLYLNNQGIFADRAVAAGVAAQGLGMGALAFDYDNDLDIDLYWTTWPGDTAPAMSNVFYRNNGNGRFTDVTQAAGVADTGGWGISANVGDIDLDGHQDMLVGNGFDASSSASVLFRNLGNGRFEDVTHLLPDLPSDLRGITFADYDNDGDQDIFVVSGPNQPSRLYRNDSNNTNNWVKLRLQAPHASGLGARVTVHAGQRSWLQEFTGTTGRGNQNPLELVFGVGNASRIDRVDISWPSGQQQQLRNIAINHTHTVYEPGPRHHDYNGSWFLPGEPGHWLHLEELANQLTLVSWPVYDNQGNNTWLLFLGRRAHNRLSGQVIEVNGGQFPPTGLPTQVSSRHWGSASLEFSDCNSGSISWQPLLPGYSAATLPIRRLTAPLASSCQAAGTSALSVAAGNPE